MSFIKIFSLILLGVLALSFGVVYADMPIDIDAIGQMDRTEHAVTTRAGVDLFSEEATEINEVILSRRSAIRETTKDGLFYSDGNYYQVDRMTQLAEETVSLALFTDGVAFRESETRQVEQGIHPLLTLSVLILCSIVGFLIAKASLSKEEEI